MTKRPKNPDRKKHKKVELWKFYEVKDGQLIRKKKTCPRCKSFLAESKNRVYCGSCGYAVIDSAGKTPEKAEELKGETSEGAGKETTEEQRKAENTEAPEEAKEEKSGEAEENQEKAEN